MFEEKSFARKLFFSLVLLAVSLATSAQNITLTGKVTDDAGNGIVGVTVLLKGTSTGTTSGIDGSYTLYAAPSGQSVLRFECLGYQTVEAPFMTGKSVYNATLHESFESLDDVVVVAYGVQKKVNLTGAVSSMKVSDVTDIPVSNASALLQGRMSGVTVSSFSSQPGKDEDYEIRIRGIGTFNNSNPLILIDGVEGTLNSVAPEDIENMSVLKDAASASIYGVRAANGVILITTKKGDAANKHVTYSGSYGLQQATVLPTFVDSWQWATLFNEEKSILGDASKNYTAEMIRKLKDGSDPDHFANTNWMEEIFRIAPIQKHYISMTGGGKDSHYMASVGYVSQKGIMMGTDTQKANFRLNADTKYIDMLTLGMNLAGSYQNTTEPQGGVWDIFNFAANKTRPSIPTYYSNGKYGAYDGNPSFTSYSVTPLYSVSKTSDADSYKFDGKLFATLEPIRNLKINSSFAYQLYADLTTSDGHTSKFYSADGKYTESGIPTLYQTNQRSQQWIQENTISYTNTIADAHDFSVLVGESTQFNGIKYNEATGMYFLSDEVHVMDAAQTTSAKGNERRATLRSFFGRVNYSYKNRYLIEANIRRDETSRIPAKNRVGYFPSVSAGWNVTEEPFMEDQSLFDLIKVRASWGKLGNQEIGYYPYAATYSIGYANYVWGTSKEIGAAATSAANDDIKWEVTATANVGLDLGLFDNRFNLSLDVFDKVSSDILLQLPVSALLGVDEAPFVNAAEVSNKGWDLNLGYRDQWGDWGFGATLNLSHIVNNIEDVNGREDWINGWCINRAGSPINAYYGYQTDGLYMSQEEIDAVPVTIGSPHVGDLKYVDISGPEGVPDGKITDDDRTVIGNPFPKLSYGLNLTATYRNFDFAMFLQGVSGIDRVFLDFPTVEGGVTANKMNRYNAENNPSGTFPAMGNQAYNQMPSSYWVNDASYMRIKNLELGYTIPAKVLNKVKINSMRVYLSAQNLLTATKVKNYDPEKVATDANNATYPNSRTISVGVNISL